MTATAALLTKHRDLALSIARAYVRRLPRHIERAELEHLALVGLWEWSHRHPDDDAPGWRFGAASRIRGSILDDMRRQDWMPRRRGATSELRVIGADDVDPEWASHWASAAATPEDVVADGDAVAEAWRAPLASRERRIVRLRHERGHEWQDIAHDLRISQPRACQIYARALARMQAHLCAGRAALRVLADERPAVAQRSRRDTCRALGRCWQCQAPLTGSRIERGSRRGQPHTTCAECRAKKASYRRTLRAGTRPPEPEPTGIYPKEVPSMPMPDPVTSTLPEDGLDLPAELARYRAWLVEQALVRAGGNRAAAARLLRINRTTLVEMLRRSRHAPAH